MIKEWIKIVKQKSMDKKTKKAIKELDALQKKYIQNIKS